jgi:hypothetical protein
MQIQPGGTWEVDIERMVVGSQPGQIAPETPISKITRAKQTRGVAQVVVPDLQVFNPEFTCPPPPKKRKKADSWSRP